MVALWDCDVDPPKKVSNEQQIIAEHTSDQPAERQFKITLNLGIGVKNKTYYLRLLDVDPKAVKQELARIPFEVDLLIQDDFGDL
jgi:predicted transcriptional regulator